MYSVHPTNLRLRYLGVSSQGLSQFLHRVQLVHQQPDAYLLGLGVLVDNSHIHWSLHFLGDGQRHRKEGVESVALAPTIGTGQRRPVERLEEVVDEAVVTSHVIGQGLCCHSLVSPTDAAL